MGENERWKYESSSSQLASDWVAENERRVLDGAGIWLGVFGRRRGVVLSPGVMALDGVGARDPKLGICSGTC